jgi:hypothetical protein
MLELTTEEAADLAAILTGALGDLRMEIANTDSMDMREDLKEREVMIKSLLIRLAALAD